MGSLKIVHEKYADKNNLKEVRARHWREFQAAIQQNPQIEPNLVRVSCLDPPCCLRKPSLAGHTTEVRLQVHLS